MKAVMYHYVREAQQELPHFRYLALTNFKRQLDWFEQNGGIAQPSDFLSYLNHREMSGKYLLTFDDGLQEHFHYVAPELKRRNAWGVFFVCSKTLQPDCDLLPVHKVHYLLGTLGVEKFYELANEQIEDMDALVPMDAYGVQNSQRQEKVLKYVFNYALATEQADAILNVICMRLGVNTELLAKQFYLNNENLTLMKNQGLLIAPHSVSHRLLSHCSEQDSQFQIEHSLKTLRSFNRPDFPQGFCIPYGGTNSYHALQLQQLQRAGAVYNFIVKSADMNVESSLLELPRYDCNEFPHGQSSIGVDIN